MAKCFALQTSKKKAWFRAAIQPRQRISASNFSPKYASLRQKRLLEKGLWQNAKHFATAPLLTLLGFHLVDSLRNLFEYRRAVRCTGGAILLEHNNRIFWLLRGKIPRKPGVQNFPLPVIPTGLRGRCFTRRCASLWLCMSPAPLFYRLNQKSLDCMRRRYAHRL